MATPRPVASVKCPVAAARRPRRLAFRPALAGRSAAIADGSVFSQAFNSVVGGGQGGGAQPLSPEQVNAEVQAVQHAANHQGPNGQYSGELDRAGRNSALDITNSANAYLKDKGDDKDAAENWFMALAKAMGKQMGEWAGKLANDSQELNALKGTSSNASKQEMQANSEAFGKLQARMQADAQMFGLISNSTSTVLKAIGEGLSSVARKQ